MLLVTAQFGQAQNLIRNGGFRDGYCAVDTNKSINNDLFNSLSVESQWALTHFDSTYYCSKCPFNAQIGGIRMLLTFKPTKNVYSCATSNLCYIYHTYPLNDSMMVYNVPFLRYSNAKNKTTDILNRGYITQKLSNPLEIGHQYYFYGFRTFALFLYRPTTGYNFPYRSNPMVGSGAMDYKLSSFENVKLNTSHDAFGMALSTNKIPDDFDARKYLFDYPLPTSPIQRKLRFEMKYDTVWKKFDGTFLADSAYQHITFGNFWKTSEINFSRPLDDSSTMPDVMALDSMNLWDVTFKINGKTKFCSSDLVTLGTEYYSRGYTVWYNQNKDSIAVGDTFKAVLNKPQWIFAKRKFPEIEYENSDSIFIVISGLLKENYSLAQINDSCNLPAILEVQPSSYNYSWNGIYKSNRDTFTTVQKVELVVYDSIGCTDTTHFVIKTPFKMIVNRIGDTCDLPAQLAAIPGSATYTWNGNIGSNIAFFDSAQSITVIGEQDNCRDTAHLLISPEIDFEVFILSDSCLLPAVLQMSNLNYEYRINNQLVSNNTTINNPGIITIEARLKDCNKQISIEIPICIYTTTYYIPNAFSPNNDGINDRFKPVTTGLKKYTLRIYNRWGEKLYDAANDPNGWDGTYQGYDVQSGLYHYLLEMQFINGKIVNLNGFVNIVR